MNGVDKFLFVVIPMFAVLVHTDIVGRARHYLRLLVHHR